MRYLAKFHLFRGPLLAAATLSAALAATPLSAQTAPKVVVSIKPLHSLAAAVMGDLGDPVLLIEGASSPHTYSLRPSQARALSKADLVIWVGPSLEGFLQRPLAALASDARSLRADSMDGVKILSARSGGVWGDETHEHTHGEENTHEDGHAHEDEHEHDRAQLADGEKVSPIDPHLWLDPTNAQAITRAIAQELARQDPANADAYRANAERYAERLAVLDRRLRERLRPFADETYIVFHDAYQYFEAHYALSPAGAVTVTPGRAPGVRRVLEIQKRIRSAGARCLFAEPQFPPALVDSLAADTDVRTAVLDPVGADIPPGPDAYPRLLDSLAEAVAGCLGAAS
jgi:zinc transport system substrate-binding protein